MLQDSKAFSGFSVDDAERAKQFYGETLGLECKPVPGMEEYGLFYLHTSGNNPILVYPKPNHQPATFTILNFPVDDIEAAMEELKGKGVSFDRVDNIPGVEQDDKLIMRGKQQGMGADVAWFKDPAGNPIALMEQ